MFGAELWARFEVYLTRQTVTIILSVDSEGKQSDSTRQGESTEVLEDMEDAEDTAGISKCERDSTLDDRDKE